MVVVYKFVGDLHFYATADAEENEVILSTVLNAFFETISLLLTCVHAAASRAACAGVCGRAVQWSLTLGLPRVVRTRSNVDKRSALENLDLVFMTLDELVDGG